MSREITPSSLSDYAACPRRYYYRRAQAPTEETELERMTGAFRVGVAEWNGRNHEVAREIATATYDRVPYGMDRTAWDVERETVSRLLEGYFSRYEPHHLVRGPYFPTEPLRNPKTGACSQVLLSSTIDGILQLQDGRLAVLQYRVVNEDISPESDYWLRTRFDSTVGLILHIARSTGIMTSTVLLDVTRLPIIQRETGESAEDYGRRLAADISEQPDQYYERCEVPRSAEELAEYHVELWRQACQIREAHRRGWWWRNVDRWTCGDCAYSPICLRSHGS